MRKLKANEKFIKEYPCFYLIEVACPKNNFYRDTIPKWEQRDFTTDIKQSQEDKMDKYGYKIKYRR